MQTIDIKDKNYPELLKQIYSPPKTLFCLGKLKAKEKYPLAVVGTRKISAYGKKITKYLVKELVKRDFTIISGLALGVDTIAHEAALENKGRTIAVLGSGIERIYPFQNKNLARKIILTNNALISEYPANTPPSKWTFPARNRIISGMSLGTLVIEAPEKSGALITARFALDQGREVFAVPGNIFYENSKGCHKLIKMGAKPVTKPEDILDAFDFQINQGQKQIFTDFEEEKIILNNLKKSPCSINELIKKTELEPLKILSLLTMMQINGKVKKIKEKYFLKNFINIS